MGQPSAEGFQITPFRLFVKLNDYDDDITKERQIGYTAKDMGLRHFQIVSLYGIDEETLTALHACSSVRKRKWQQSPPKKTRNAEAIRQRVQPGAHLFPHMLFPLRAGSRLRS